ncbi:MAG: patatin-like phospholipase family protein [Burkholderiales bacterium]|nr:patatin-like phospholipase family protein [Burkholderiales bacterium]
MELSNGARPRLAIVLTGGGARAAYQAGVLRAIADLVPKEAGNPFPIVCGTSAGAVNAVAIAADAANFRRAALRLQAVWKNFHAEQVYRTDLTGVLSNSGKWLLAAVTGGLRRQAVSLLDSTPLRELLAARVDFGSIGRCIEQGRLYALGITCSGYSSGQSVCFFQGAQSIEPWRRARRIGIAMPVGIEHLLASSALPFIFPAVRINREYFGDGSMRQIAPLSPALHLGADRVLVVSVGRQHSPERTPARAREKSPGYPTLAQIAGHALDSIFLDSLEVDLERLQRINRTLSMIPAEVLKRNGSRLRHVDFMVISPSEELDKIALRHADSLPRTIRALFRSVGAMQRGGATLLSYLLFERAFCRELIALGYKDAMARQDNLRGFLGYATQWYCELRNNAA